MDDPPKPLSDWCGKRLADAETQIAVLTARLIDIQEQLDHRIEATTESTRLALDAVEKAAALGQATADKAMARAEAAAEKVLLQSMIQGVKDNFKDEIQNLKDTITMAMSASEKAISKAEMATEKRFEGVNEFRGQLSDQATRFMPRTEAETWSRSNAEKIDTLASRLDRIEGRSGGLNAGWGYLVAAVSVAGTMAVLFFND